MKAIFYCLVVAVLSACNDHRPKAETPETIIEIGYRGVSQSGEEDLSITKDSIHYTATMQDPAIARKNSPEIWQKLVLSFHLSDFKNVKQGREHLSYDGSDATIIIKTNKSEYKLFNGYEDSRNFKKIENLDREISNILQQVVTKQTIE